MSLDKRPFVVMAKPVGSRCNMRCAYCYYLDKRKYSAHQKQTRMSQALLERLIREVIEASLGPIVSFVWHGGEPTLAGLEFYQRAVELQRKYLPPGWQAWNNLQTNGLLNQKWCRFLKENRFDVGVSIDGNEIVHNANRRDRGGKPTYERVRQAIGLLRDAGIQPDLLCTVNASTLDDPEGVYWTLAELGCGWVQFIPIVVCLPEGGFSSESVTPERYGDFLCRVFDLWVHNSLGKMDVQLFAEMARILAGGQAAYAGWPRNAAGRWWWKRTAASTPATTSSTRPTAWEIWSMPSWGNCWTVPHSLPLAGASGKPSPPSVNAALGTDSAVEAAPKTALKYRQAESRAITTCAAA